MGIGCIINHMDNDSERNMLLISVKIVLVSAYCWSSHLLISLFINYVLNYIIITFRLLMQLSATSFDLLNLIIVLGLLLLLLQLLLL